MALSTLDFNTTFNYIPATKVFSFEDTVDYSGQSVAIANATGVIKVEAPSGSVVYNNQNHGAPDIDPSVSRLNTTTIPLPLLGDGTVMQGLYKVTYTVRIVDTTLATSYDVVLLKTFTLAYVSPTINLDLTVNYTAPLLKSTDATNYLVNLVTPTIVRDHDLFYPASLGVAAISGTSNVVSTATFYTVASQAIQYSSSLTSTLTYNFSNGWYVTDQIVGYDYLDVVSSDALCGVYCGLRAQYNRWQSAKGSVVREKDEKVKFEVMVSIAQMVSYALDCGKDEDVAAYVAEIKKIGHEGDCSCGDTEPVLVTGLGGGNTVVVAAGSGLAIATATGGTTTTYTLSLDPTLLTKLNAAYNTVVDAGTGISVAVATATDGTKTYTITNTQLQPNIVETIKDILFTAGSVPTINTDSTKTYGSNLQGMTVEAVNDASGADWQVNNASFTATGFFVGAATDYYPQVDIIYSIGRLPISSLTRRRYMAEVTNYTSTTISFRLKDTNNGQPVTGLTIDGAYTRIKLLIKIIS